MEGKTWVRNWEENWGEVAPDFDYRFGIWGNRTHCKAGLMWPSHCVCCLFIMWPSWLRCFWPATLGLWPCDFLVSVSVASRTVQVNFLWSMTVKGQDEDILDYFTTVYLLYSW